MRFFLTILNILPVTLALAQAMLVKDINPGTAGSVTTSSEMIAFGNQVVLIADDGATGEELWISDGTEIGTVQVIDLWDGTDQSGALRFFTTYNGQIYFWGRNPVAGLEVWRSNGTAAGTAVVNDACPGLCFGPFYDYPPQFIPFNGQQFFMSESTAEGEELWTTDGTAAGTGLFKDLSPGSFSSTPGNFAEFNGKLYFSANSFPEGRELWSSDGTPAGTVLVKDISVGLNAWGDPANLIVAGNKLFFTATTFDAGTELWVTDGTEAGTVQVADINPGSGDGIPDGSEDFAVLPDGRLLFVGNDGMNGDELWITDGTDAGTLLVKNVCPGGCNAFIEFLGIVNGNMLFAARTFDEGRELWRTDGTTAGTVMVQDLWSGFLNGLAGDAVVHNNRLYFAGNNGQGQLGIYRSTGVGNSTLVAPFSGSLPYNFVVTGSTLYMFANQGATGDELWKLSLSAPEVTITMGVDTACQGQPVLFAAAGSGAQSYTWNFGSGAQPSMSQGAGPHSVTYNAAGTRNVRVIATNPFGADTAFQQLTVLPVPSAAFSFVLAWQLAMFTATGPAGNTYSWDFGDGSTGTGQEVEHVYDQPGTYTVVLTASNGGCIATSSQTVMITSRTNELDRVASWVAQPNPANGAFELRAVEPVATDGALRVVDAIGRTILSQPVRRGTQTMVVPALQAGVYTVYIGGSEGWEVLRVVVR